MNNVFKCVFQADYGVDNYILYILYPTYSVMYFIAELWGSQSVA